MSKFIKVQITEGDWRRAIINVEAIAYIAKTNQGIIIYFQQDRTVEIEAVQSQIAWAYFSDLCEEEIEPNINLP